MREKIENLKARIKEIISEISYINDDGGIEIYTDYSDRELSTETISDIMESKNPREYFYNMLDEWATDYAYTYGKDELEESIRKKLSETENKVFTEFFDEIWEYVEYNIYFYYNADDFNVDIDVNLMIDCGNWNYDCTCDNVLDYYGNGILGDNSSMLWLAKTQGKATALRKACKKAYRGDGNYVDREIQGDKFIESCIQEFENLPSHMATVTFLLKINLFQLFDLIEIQKEEYDEQGKYDPRNNTKSKSYIVLDKSTMCGLYNPWDGGGSVLEVELDKDVKVPIKYCIFTVDGCKTYGYDVNEVYGLIGSCWQKTLVKIQKVD